MTSTPGDDLHLPQMDWEQVRQNGGPPCFAVNTLNDIPNRYCGRAERWEGHGSAHAYVSLNDLLARTPPVSGERRVGEKDRRTGRALGVGFRALSNQYVRQGRVDRRVSLPVATVDSEDEKQAAHESVVPSEDLCLPWRVESFDPSTSMTGRYLIIDVDGRLVSSDDDSERLGYICTAVNSHAALKDAAQSLIDCFSDIEQSPSGGVTLAVLSVDFDARLKIALRSAIKAAGEAK